MDQTQFREKYSQEVGMYKAWGKSVTESVTEEVKKTHDVNDFFKIKPEPRTKEINSLISKAFFRNKNYSDPYNNITDKVGTRFVVLLTEHVEFIKNVIENCSNWDYSLDRDFEKEREEKPTLFEYQSVHYIVRNKVDISYGDIEIKKGTPCEIQIRTLLQHAYSELTHNTIYKPASFVPKKVYRLVARSMALIENTDEIFSKVNEMINMEANQNNQIKLYLDQLYSTYNVPQFEEKLNTFIFDAIKTIVTDQDIINLEVFLKDNPSIKNIIDRKYDSDLLYRQPIVLLLLYLVENKEHGLINNWPLPDAYLHPLFSDLGHAYPN